MTNTLPAADVFIKAAADLSGRDPGQLDEQEAIHILQEYGRKPQGDLYRQLTTEAAAEWFSDPQTVAEWQDIAEHWDGEMPDGIAFAVQRGLSPIIRAKATKLYEDLPDDLPQDDPQRVELKNIAIAAALSPEAKAAMQQAAKITQGLAAAYKDTLPAFDGLQEAYKSIMPAFNGLQEAYKSIMPTLEGIKGIAAAAGGLIESIGLKANSSGINLSEMFENWAHLREAIAEVLANNPTFLLYEETKSGRLAPYIAEEIQKPQYEGKSIEQLFEEAETDDNGDLLETSLIMQAIRAAREAAGIPADKEEPERVTITRAQSVEYPLDKPNSIIWSLLEKDTKGQISFNMAKYGSRQQIPAYYAINFDELGNDITITKRLLPFDKRVYIAVSALFNAGNNVITLSQIYYTMGYTGRPGTKDLTRINEAITKMTTARIFFDNEQEAAKYKYARFKYDGSLLPIERGTALVNGQLADAAIRIFREPPLISFAKQRKQITTIDVKLLQSPISKTDANLQIDDYLIERISKGKNGKARSCRILFKTLFERTGIPDKPKTNTEKQQRKRAPDKVKKYLTHYQQQGFIKSFTVEKDGVTVHW